MSHFYSRHHHRLICLLIILLAINVVSVLCVETNDALSVGDQYFRQSNYSAALNEYNKLGNDVRALFKKAEIYRLQHKYDFVKVECQRIIDNTDDNSKDLPAHLLLAEVDLLLGDFDGALQNAKATMQLDPYSSQAKQLLSDAKAAQKAFSSIAYLGKKEDVSSFFSFI